MLSELAITICYLVICTGKRTWQFFYSEICFSNSHKHVLASEKSAV